MGSSISTEELLKLINEECTSEFNLNKHLEDLFKIYDKDNSGTITSFESNQVFREIVDYIMKHNISPEVSIIEFQKLKPKLLAYINTILDEDNDGKITKEEFFSRFKKCLSIKIVSRKSNPNYEH